MKNLYVFITNKIKEVTENVGFTHVSKQTVFPYVTYKYTSANSIKDEIEDVIIEIDIWNKEREGVDFVSEIEDITSQIKKRLKNERYCNDSYFYMFQLIGNLNIQDEDELIHRRQLRFRVRKYN